MSKIKFDQKLTFCRSGPVKNVQNGSWIKFHIFAGPDLSKCQKWKLAINSHFAGPDLSKMSKIKFGQKFTFLQLRTCQKRQK